MAAVISTLIERDDRGVAWISGTKIKVIEVALDKVAYGWSPEEIHFQHNYLSLAQIHMQRSPTTMSTRRSSMST